MDRETQTAGLRKHSRESNELVRECLKQAMIRMAEETDYNDISVTKLCQRAGVSRMAFYRNYDVPGDVIYEIATDITGDIVSHVGSPFRSTTSREWYVKAFEIIYARREEMQLMFRENYQFQWMRIANGVAVHDPNFSTEKKYQRIMWSGGFENAISFWLNNGLKESPEEMAEYCIKYLPHLLASS